MSFFLPALAWGQATTMTGSSGLRECASCHFQWIESFEQPQAVLLVEKPAEAMEAESETCLSCHDGSTVDSRKRVWLEHSHQTDIDPPPNMTIPELLPLKDGKIACRTCHTAHAEVGPEDAANAVFLRVPNDASQLCRMCHPDKVPVEDEHGTHPIGEMPWDIPQELIDAGALVQPNQRLIYCQACHTAHGSKQDHLLIMDVQENHLCLTCHSLRRPGMWHDIPKTAHPDRPVIQLESQFDAIENMGTRIGNENRLICLSCHRMHDGKSGKFMLAMPLEDSTFCVQCHPDQVDLLQTRHNPRLFAAGIENLEGVTIEQAGPCSACHMFHSVAQAPHPSEYDPLGICLTCHTRGGIAGRTGTLKGEMTNTHPLNIPVPQMIPDSILPLFESHVEDQNQPVITCQTCHNLHQSAHPNFLRSAPEDLCRTCHQTLVERMEGNPHDPQSFGGSWPVNVEVDQSCRSCHQQIHTWDQNRQMSQCSLCHQMHSWDNNMNLWAFTPHSLESYSSEDICVTCHNDIQWAFAEPNPPVKSIIHPREISSKTINNLALLSNDSTMQRLNCQSCHDPHSTPEVPFLLNVSVDSPTTELCYGCHENARSVELTLHDPRNLNEDAGNPGCAPCHTVHAIHDPSTEMFRITPPGSLNKTPTELLCLGCHENSDYHKNITFIEHPEPLLMAGAIRLWAPFQTAPVAYDRISCTTCHLPHGRQTDFTASLDASPQIRKAQISAYKLLQRPNVAQTLCSQCHGADAGKLFLYYHYPEKR